MQALTRRMDEMETKHQRSFTKLRRDNDDLSKRLRRQADDLAKQVSQRHPGDGSSPQVGAC